jgi:enoyl-CoA hydratase/carnithine racemase
MATDTYEQIRTRVDGDVLIVTLHRPEKLNAWTYVMQGELVDAITKANHDPAIGAIVITGEGRGFCAGADMSAVFQARGSEGATRGLGTDWISFVRQSKPVVGAINGPAYGVGLTLVLPVDFLVMSADAKLSCAFIKMGIVPELASSTFLVRRAGWGAASDLMLSGRAIDAAEARELRVVDEVVAAADLLDAAIVRARSYAANSATALRFVKQLLTENACETDLSLVQKRETTLLAQAFESPEHKEAVAAFLEKRPPKFR